MFKVVTRGPFVIQSQMANSIFLKGQTGPIRMKKLPPKFQTFFRFKTDFEYDSRLKAKHDILKGQTRPINYEFKPCTGSNLWPEVNSSGFNPIFCIRLFRLLNPIYQYIVSFWLGFIPTFSIVCMYRISALHFHDMIFLPF